MGTADEFLAITGLAYQDKTTKNIYTILRNTPCTGHGIGNE